MAGDVLSEFREFCRVDLRLSKRKVKDHCWQVGRFLQTMGRDPAAISRSEVRSYLMLFLDKAPATYAGVLKSLKVFFRDYLKRGSVVRSFRFPDIPLSIIEIPPKKDVQKFYYALKTGKARSVYLMYATSGLRKGELLPLLLKDINLESRMIVPAKRQWTTKNTWVTFYNQEAAKELTEYLSARKDSKPKLFPFGKAAYQRIWKQAEKESGVHIRPQILREWFAEEMGNLGVPDRYVDAFCGRVPKSVLAKHYTDYAPGKLKKIYEKAKLRVLN